MSSGAFGGSKVNKGHPQKVVPMKHFLGYWVKQFSIQYKKLSDECVELIKKSPDLKADNFSKDELEKIKVYNDLMKCVPLLENSNVLDGIMLVVDMYMALCGLDSSITSQHYIDIDDMLHDLVLTLKADKIKVEHRPEHDSPQGPVFLNLDKVRTKLKPYEVKEGK